MKKNNINYSTPLDKNLPHVVKFSGGRSSGMMLFTLLKRGVLHAQRGDVVVFNNTSAEHPATYKFVMECKKRCEQDYKIPFFITEFQTYEDAVAGLYNRVTSYKMVNSEPYSEQNPDGYHWKGEVFEEMLSLKAFVPHRFKSRICTTMLKILVSKLFIEDWSSGREKIEHKGHFHGTSRVSVSDLYYKHKKHKGETPEEIFGAKKEYLLSCPFVREEQEFKKYTQVKELHRPKVEDDGQYCSLIGLRADEPRRVANIRAREQQEKKDAYTDDNEKTYFPLVDLDISREDVNNFWQKQGWDLNFPPQEQLSNCVFCFLKGEANISNIIASDSKKYVPKNRHFADITDTPTDINWWITMEEKYGRDLKKEERAINKDKFNGEQRAFIGFFGTDNTYRNIKERARSRVTNNAYIDESINSIDCNCTD